MEVTITVEAKRKLTDDPVVIRIIEKLEAAGKKDKELIDYLGMARGTFTAWKYRGMKSYMNHIYEIASFLQTTPEYLLTGEDGNEIGTLIDTEIELIRLYREVDFQRKELISKIVVDLVKSYRYEKMTAGKQS